MRLSLQKSLINLRNVAFLEKCHSIISFDFRDLEPSTRDLKRHSVRLCGVYTPVHERYMCSVSSWPAGEVHLKSMPRVSGGTSQPDPISQFKGAVLHNRSKSVLTDTMPQMCHQNRGEPYLGSGPGVTFEKSTITGRKSKSEARMRLILRLILRLI